MIIVLPIFPADAQVPFSSEPAASLLADPAHFLRSLPNAETREIRIFCPDRTTADTFRAVLPEAQCTIIKPDFLQIQHTPPGTSACIRALLAEGIDPARTACVLNVRNPLLKNERIRQAADLFSRTHRTVLSVLEPRDHPVQIQAGKNISTLDAAAFFDPDFHLPDETVPLPKQFSTSTQTASALCTVPFLFKWPGYTPEEFQNKLFALLRHNALPANPRLIPVEMLRDYSPHLFSLTGTYWCESEFAARRCFFHDARQWIEEKITGISFFGDAEAPGLILKKHGNSTAVHLREDSLSKPERMQVAHIVPEAGSVTDMEFPLNKLNDKNGFTINRTRYTPSLAEIPAVSGESGVMLITWNTAGCSADFPVPAIAECEMWSQDWVARRTMNTKTGRTILGRQEFPLVHSPCSALVLGRLGDIGSSESLIQNDRASGLPLNEAEALSVETPIDLCRIRAFQGETQCDPDMLSAFRPGKHNRHLCESHAGEEYDRTVRPPLPLMDMAQFIVHGAENDDFGLSDTFQFNIGIRRALYDPALHRLHSAEDERTKDDRTASDLLDTAIAGKPGTDDADIREALEKACSINPLLPGLREAVLQAGKNLRDVEWAHSLLNAFHIRQAPMPQKIELAFPFTLTFDNRQTLYACGIGDETGGPRTWRINPAAGTSEIMFEGVKYASVTPDPETENLFALRFEGDLPFCSVLDILDPDGSRLRSVDLSRPEHGGIRYAFYTAFQDGRAWFNDCLENRIVSLDRQTFRFISEVRRPEFRDLSQIRAHGRDLLIPLPGYHSICRLSPSGETRLVQNHTLLEPADLVHDPDEHGFWCVQSCHPIRMRGHLCRLDENFEPIFQTNQSIGFPAQMHLLDIPGRGKHLALLDRNNGFQLISLAENETMSG